MRINTLEPWIDSRELEQLSRVIDSTFVTEGPLTKEFEQMIIDYTGAKYAVSMANGTVATFAALKALGIKRGDEVIVPNLTFAATANAVILAGAIPKFCDVRLDDFSIDLSAAEKLISQNTRVIMPVHLYGKPVDMDSVISFAKKHNIKIVEDAAQGVGVFFNKKHTGTFSDVGILSFYGNKTITTGEGGVCLTNSAELATKLYQLKNHGREVKGTFIHETIGFNFAFTDLQAAIGISQLKKINEIIDRRFEIYSFYKKRFGNEFDLVEYSRDAGEMPWVNSLKISQPDRLEIFLSKSNIVARRFFYPLDLQPCYENTNFIEGPYPNSHILYDGHLSLPSSHLLNFEQLGFICDEITRFGNLPESKNIKFKKN